jgi:glycosyltransferase involved in cell wall biosynthesis
MIDRPLLSVVIPCFNEAKTILAVIDAVRASPYAHKEIIVVDDGSRDGTGELLMARAKSDGDGLKVFCHEKNMGKGAALRTGFAAATGEIVIVQDADLEYNPAEFPVLVEPILADKADVVYGSRFAGGQPHRVAYFWHRVGNGVLTLFSNMLTNINLTDMETGYKAFRRSVIQSIVIEENRFGFEPEITAKVSASKCRIYEVGISYSGRTYEEGKKINWKDGVWALVCIVRYNLFR